MTYTVYIDVVFFCQHRHGLCGVGHIESNFGFARRMGKTSFRRGCRRAVGLPGECPARHAPMGSGSGNLSGGKQPDGVYFVPSEKP